MVPVIPFNYHPDSYLIVTTTANKERGIIYGPIPPHSRLFTGRKDYLGKLRDYFGLRNHPWPRRAFLLHGMGGGGKTQIALRFVEECSHLSVPVHNYSAGY